MRSNGDLLRRLDVALGRKFADRRLKVAELARAVGISERQLQRRLHALTGKTPARYLLEYRINRARDYLRLPLPIGDVAHSVGFSSHAHFAYSFKSAFGMTPSDFKKKFEGETAE